MFFHLVGLQAPLVVFKKAVTIEPMPVTPVLYLVILAQGLLRLPVSFLIALPTFSQSPLIAS